MLIHALTFSIILILFVTSSTNASPLEFQSLLEFRKGIKSDPSGKIFSTWNSSQLLSNCPSAFYGVICDQSSSMVVGVHLEDLDLMGKPKLKTLIPLKSLKNLTLSSNFFTGKLGNTFGRFTSLQHLDISNNKFYGPIPSDILQGVVLEGLDLSCNRFSGSFPTVNSSSLKFLDLSKNNLSGQLPFELYILGRLEYLDLSENNFTGVIPKRLSPNLSFFNVSYNNLEGTIPENVRSFPVTSFYPGNTMLVLPDRGPSNPDGRKHHSSKSWVKIAIIVVCIGAVLIIAGLVLFACDLPHPHYFQSSKRIE